MSLSLFYEVPAGAMETLFDVQDQRLCFTWSGMLGGGKNLQDVFIDLDGAIEMAIQSKNPKAVALVKWSSKKAVVENTRGASASY